MEGLVYTYFGVCVVLVILVFVFAVLQIILFFKIWGMTNDVEKIERELRLATHKNKKRDVRRAMMAGDEQLAQKALMESLIEDIEYIADRGYRNHAVYEKVVKHYEPAFSQLGMEIPRIFYKIKCPEDIRNIIMLGDN